MAYDKAHAKPRPLTVSKLKAVPIPHHRGRSGRRASSHIQHHMNMHTLTEVPSQGPNLIISQATPGHAICSQPLGVDAYGGDVTLTVRTGHPGLIWIEGSFDMGLTWTHRFKPPTRVTTMRALQNVSFTTSTPHSKYSGCTHLRVCWLPDTLEPEVQVKYVSGQWLKQGDPAPVPEAAGGLLDRVLRWMRPKTHA